MNLTEPLLQRELYIQELTAENNRLRVALRDALSASGVIDGKVCGCGFIGPEDYAEYKEAEERIQKAQAVADCHKITTAGMREPTEKTG